MAILDRAAQLKLNAIIFQVRPACDALYASKLEPWSEYLTGAQGRAPQPWYDPLEFAVAEAHRRGLELHAWFNPYRALHPSAKGPLAASHVSETRPQLVRKYGRHLWLDPGERETQEYSLAVVMDVVRRYDIDGVHFDDYFYPYKEKDRAGVELEFPDEASWMKSGAGGKLSRDDWRRENVNVFIRRVCQTVKSAKPWVKFGVSPFGIWRPGHPAQIHGLDAYAALYADSRQWLRNGWLDYCAPQLYWAIEPKAQSYPALLQWWAEQNPKGRHLWPGLNSAKVNGSGWKPEEIVNQIRLTRKQPGATGHIHWSVKSLMSERNGLAAALQSQTYDQPALVPASPWMGRSPLGRPSVFASGFKSGNLRLAGRPCVGDRVCQWLLQTRTGGTWRSEVLRGGAFTRIFGSEEPDAIAVTPLDRFGNAGPPAVLEKKSGRAD